MRFLNAEAMSLVLQHSQSTGTERLVLLALAGYVNTVTGIAFPSVATLARDTRLHRVTVCKKIKALESLGELRVIRAANRVNRYLLNLNCDRTGRQPVDEMALHAVNRPVTPDVATRLPDKREKKELSMREDRRRSRRSPTSRKDSFHDPGREVRTRFKPPTLADVQQFRSSENLTPSAERFFFYYESVGWRNIANWQAKFREWHAGDSERTPSPATESGGGLARLKRERDEERRRLGLGAVAVEERKQYDAPDD